MLYILCIYNMYNITSRGICPEVDPKTCEGQKPMADICSEAGHPWASPPPTGCSAGSSAGSTQPSPPAAAEPAATPTAGDG